MEFKDYFSPEVPVLFVGAPGIGKTERVVSSFDYVEVILLSTCQSEDIGGIPYREGEFDYKTIPSIFQRLQKAHDEGKTTALFLDEIDKATREVADTLLTLVCHRRVGNAKLPKDTCIIAAANPPEWGGGDGLSVPMLNRFSVIEYPISADAWAAWARENFDGFYERAIREFECGNLSLFESVGSGIETKTTSPRSVVLAFKAIKRLKKDAQKIVEGLLTPIIAQRLLDCFDFSAEYREIFEKVDSMSVKPLHKIPRKPHSILEL